MKIWERFTCRAPQGARRYGQRSHGVLLMIFQPTRPLRGATNFVNSSYSHFSISTHAPLAGRDQLKALNVLDSQISTHAPLAGRDGHYSRDGGIDNIFQPTRPLRGATRAARGRR